MARPRPGGWPAESDPGPLSATRRRTADARRSARTSMWLWRHGLDSSVFECIFDKDVQGHGRDAEAAQIIREFDDRG